MPAEEASSCNKTTQGDDDAFGGELRVVNTQHGALVCTVIVVCVVLGAWHSCGGVVLPWQGRGAVRGSLCMQHVDGAVTPACDDPICMQTTWTGCGQESRHVTRLLYTPWIVLCTLFVANPCLATSCDWRHLQPNKMTAQFES